MPVPEGRVCAAGERSEPAEPKRRRRGLLYLIPRKQVGITRGWRHPSRAKRRSELSCSKANARARADNSRWAGYLQVQSVLVDPLRQIRGFGFRRVAGQVEQCHRWFRSWKCANGHLWARPGFSCKNRLCPFEMRARSMAAVHRFGPVLEGLRRGIDDLFSAFRRLYHSKLWAEVRGALAVLEVTFNEQERTWHPHINVVVDGPFIEKSQLDAVWSRSTRGKGRITWIERADHRTVFELVKYITKLSDFVHIPEAVQWFLMAAHGKRFIRTYVSLYRLKLENLDKEDGDEHQPVCPDCGCSEVQELSASLGIDDVYFDGSGTLRCCIPLDDNSEPHMASECAALGPTTMADG